MVTQILTADASAIHPTGGGAKVQHDLRRSENFTERLSHFCNDLSELLRLRTNRSDARQAAERQCLFLWRARTGCGFVVPRAARLGCGGRI